MGGDALYGKALSNALSLTLRNLAVPNWSSKTKQRVMLIGCVIPMVFAYRVGFGVARSYDQGDARAS
jgi:hypothetical protein